MNNKKSILEPWKTISEKIVFENKWFKIKEKHMKTAKGVELDYYIHEAPDSVICVCVNDEGQILIEKQYRPAIDRVSIDYPAGRSEIDDASTEEAIRRELLEEVGFSVKFIKNLQAIDTEPAFSMKKMHVFLAKGSINKDATPEETEDILSKFVEPEEILEMISNREMTCTFCISSTLLAFIDLGILTS